MMTTNTSALESKATSITESMPGSKEDEMETQTQPEKTTINTDKEHDVTAKPNDTTTPTDSEDESNYPHGVKLVIILSALCLAIFLVALDNTIISTAIPKITDHFHSITDIGWYGSACKSTPFMLLSTRLTQRSDLLTATAMQPTFGRIYTIFSVNLRYLFVYIPG